MLMKLVQWCQLIRTLCLRKCYMGTERRNGIRPTVPKRMVCGLCNNSRFLRALNLS